MGETMSLKSPYGAKPEVIEDARIVGEKSPIALFSKGLAVVVVLLLACYGVFAYFQLDKLEATNADLVTQVSLLEAKAKGSETLRTENDNLSRALKAEIARKNLLAVENTTLKGRVAQGERDLKAALDKLKAFEKPRSTSRKK